MKSISKQLICISIILLLLGVSVTSAISVENKTPIIEDEDDCGCEDKSDSRICNILEILALSLDKRSQIMGELCEVFKDIPTLEDLFFFLGLTMVARYMYIVALANELNCDWVGPYRI